MHEEYIDMVDAQFAAKSIDVCTHLPRVASPRLGENRNFAAIGLFERFRHMRMATVGVGTVKKMQALIVAVEQEFGESGNTQIGLMGMMADAHRAGAHRQTAGADAGATQSHAVRSGELPVERWQSQKALGIRCQSRGGESAGGVVEESAATHFGSSRN